MKKTVKEIKENLKNNKYLFNQIAEESLSQFSHVKEDIRSGLPRNVILFAGESTKTLDLYSDVVFTIISQMDDSYNDCIIPIAIVSGSESVADILTSFFTGGKS